MPISRARRMAYVSRSIVEQSDPAGELAVSGSGTEAYTTVANLPLSGNTTGALSFVEETNRLYIWNGTGWYNIALVNTSPTAITGADGSYAFATDGTPIVLTLVSTDPEGVPLTWSHAVTSGSLENGGGTTATISQAANVFTITPTTTEDYAGEFSLTFTASDGVNLATATSSFTLSFGPSLLHTLANPNASGSSFNDQFGFSVAISPNGNYAIAGANFESSYSGKAYIFNPVTGALLWTLNNPNAYSTPDNDQFGISVAISDNYAIVGANLEGDAGGTNSGKAYIFNPANGQLLRTLNNPNAYSTSQADYFGYSVAVSNNYAIVGALYEDDAGGSVSGKAYVFNPATGQLLWTLNNPNAYSTSAADAFGVSVAISDNYAIVGAFQEDDASGSDSGKAYIFNPATGALLWTLNNPGGYNTGYNDKFGGSVAISDDYAIVGAYDDRGFVSGEVLSAGKAYIFNPATGQLLWTLDNPNAYSTIAGDKFGWSVAISANSYVIVSAYLEDDASGTSSGKAYIFNPATGALLYTLDNPNAYSTSTDDLFGYSVSISSNNYAIVGAYQEDDSATLTSSGKAYIFKL